MSNKSVRMIWVVVIFEFVTVMVTGLLAGLQQNIKLDFEQIVLPQLAPAIGFLLVFLFFKSYRLPINFEVNQVVLLRSILGLLGPILLLGLAFVIGKGVGLKVSMTEDLGSLLSFVIIGILIGALGEEIGWRGFLQPTLEKKFSVLLSSVIVGLIWGLWHIGHYKNGALFMIGFLLFSISASIILAWMLRDTDFNIIIATLFHLSINLGFYAFFKNSLTDAKLMLINGGVWLVSAVILVALTSKDLVNM
ncbi:MAG: type II CAAX endopeptidase family protein, partial [Bacteroidota bacterium]